MKIEKDGIIAQNDGLEVPMLKLETIGQLSSTIKVELSTRFLEHFSEQLYSSPQKAFEELISNSWDAGADYVDVRISSNLTLPSSTMCILDNGASMDEAGLKALWHIAFSPKRDQSIQHGRPVVGKFGIGKLATYVLASKLTYICKADDGVVRRVTMDYASIDREKNAQHETLISDLSLNIYAATDEDVRLALATVEDGQVIQDLISIGLVDKSHESKVNDEFGGEKSKLTRPKKGTWTLVVLSGIKPIGQALRLHVLRRMLESALPFGSEMLIRVNGAALTSTKENLPIIKEWEIGPDLGIENVEIDNENYTSDTIDQNESKSILKNKKIKINIKSGSSPYPYIEIPGIGKVTGKAKLFEDKISSGKSEDRGHSNGFHVNVLGRVVNQNDSSFGESDLSHAAWSRFRMAVRADGLNPFLTTSREQFKEREEIKIFRAVLRKIFNTVRSYYDSDDNLDIAHGNDPLLKSLGALTLKPLRNQVSESLRTKAQLPELFDESGIADRIDQRKKWNAHTAENIKNAISEVKYLRTNDDSFSKFRISDSTIIINKDHPFVIEHSHSKAEKDLVRTIAMVNLLSDMHALEIGIKPSLLKELRIYRDTLLRYRAMQRRQSGATIAKILLQTQHESDHSKRMEAAVSDALRHLGFDVQDLAKSGQPEGIASAYPAPTNATPNAQNRTPPLYSFTFDAKSSKHDVAATGNIKLDGVVEHRERYKANYALVVAPGFSDGAFSVRCEQQKVTPITGQDLGRLLEYTVKYGAISLPKFREIFNYFDPVKISGWVTDLGEYLEKNRHLTIDIFLKALESLKGQIPDVLTASTIAHTCRRDLNAHSVKSDDVVVLVKGLSILIPDLVQIDGDKIAINANSKRIAEAIKVQLEQLYDDKSE
jgi:hypothetical protein